MAFNSADTIAIKGHPEGAATVECSGAAASSVPLERGTRDSFVTVYVADVAADSPVPTDDQLYIFLQKEIVDFSREIVHSVQCVKVRKEDCSSSRVRRFHHLQQQR